MQSRLFSLCFKKLGRIITLPITIILFLCAAYIPAVFSDSAKMTSRYIDRGEFYYSGGKKIPLVRHKNLFAVKFKEKDTAPDSAKLSMQSVLNRNKDLTYSPKSKFFEKRKIHLLESLNGRNGERHDSFLKSLRADADIEYALPVYVTGRDEPMVMSDNFVARFDETLSKTDIDEINAKNGVKIVKPLNSSSNTYILQAVGLKDRTTLDVANKYYEMEGVKWSHPDWIRRLEKRYTPNDPLFTKQWHLHNTGTNGAVVDADIDAPEAWDITKGDSEIIIAIIDDGVDTSHEDFAGKIVAGWDVVNDNDDPNPHTGDNHGTACAGLAVAIQDNGIGVSGSAPNCKLMPIRLLDIAATTSDEAEAFLFAAQNGADIISNSWGPPDGTGAYDPLPDVTKDAIDFAADNGRDGKGCIILWAAGNGNESVDNDGYASYEKVIAVGASTDRDQRAYYSDFGSTLDIMSPSSGGDNGITTTDRMGSNGYSNNNYTSSFGGTSAATPTAAGVAALILSVNEGLTRSLVQEILQSTADKINPSDANYDSYGFSQKYGYGRVNAYNAVIEAVNPNFSPVATIESPSDDVATVNVGNALNFAGNVFDYENAIASYHWDFDGGATDAYVEDPGSVTFNTPGIFNVTFTATDDADQSSSDSIMIFVLEEGEGIVSTIVDSSDTPIDIPDNDPNGISSNTVINTGDYLLEVRVSVNITHTYIGDLVVSIESPNGTTVKLHNRTGGSSDDIVTTYKTETTPAESLSSLIGENPQGVWTLHVIDQVGIDEGTLNEWQLVIEAISGNIPDQPDLLVKKSNVRRKRRNKIKTVAIIKNQGTAAAGTFDVDFYLSKNETLDQDDLKIKTLEISGLGPDEQIKKRFKMTKPESLNGKYYLIVEADPTNQINEIQEINNARASNRTVRIRN